MLDRALAATYEVGADLKGAAVTEVWPLVLDGMASAAVVGTPSAGEAATLGSFTASVSTWAPTHLGNVAAGSVDAIVIADDLLADLPHVAGGVAAAAGRRAAVVVPTSHVAAFAGTPLRERRRMWCAPSITAPVALVPADDDRTIDWFRRRGLDRASTTVPAVRPGRPQPGGSQLSILDASGAVPASSPPAWLVAIADGCGVDVRSHRWGIWARRHYRSQKVLVFLFDGDDEEPAMVVKLPRDAGFNDRIDVDYDAIERVHRLPGLHGSVPAPCFAGRYAGRSVAAVRAVDGRPFPVASARAPDGALARSVVEWLGELGARTARAVRSDDVAASMAEVVARVGEIFPLTPDERSSLRRQVDRLAASAPELPAVLQHGNVADWNLIVRDDGSIVFLDWEFAEPNGLPLWDVFFFLRFQDWPLRTGWERALIGRWRPRRDLHLRPASAVAMRSAIAAYRRRVDVSPAAVEPLFHLCWAHQCLNAATHETHADLCSAPMFQLLRRGLALGAAGRLEPFLAAPSEDRLTR